MSDGVTSSRWELVFSRRCFATAGAASIPRALGSESEIGEKGHLDWGSYVELRSEGVAITHDAMCRRYHSHVSYYP